MKTGNRTGFIEVFGNLKKKNLNIQILNGKRNTSNQNDPMKADGETDITFG